MSGYNSGLNLGEIIAELEKLPRLANIEFDFGSANVTVLDSYRGYYDQLALGYDGTYGGKLMTVGELLDDCTAALGKSFTGWKGGDYTMDAKTSVFVANSGCTSDTYIVGFRKKFDDWYVVDTNQDADE